MKIILKIFFSRFEELFPVGKRVELNIQNMIGKGGYGKVYEINEMYVIKSFNNNDGDEFKNSMKLSQIDEKYYNKNLIHPIAGGIDIFNNKYIILPYLKKIKIKNYNFEKTLKKIVEVQKYLIRNLNKYHMDLKPDNIMYNQKIEDFVIIDLGYLGSCEINNKVLLNYISKNYNLNYENTEKLAIYQILLFSIYILSDYELEEVLKLNYLQKKYIIEYSNCKESYKSILYKMLNNQVNFELLFKIFSII